ncbi:hypothetical protein RQP54_17660 [Curvibacter sp. APW13]|uniref:hypothetical protein n=1 Tax=Curvibacter sp. APW13 TaxID=3077236 RepID=UPI0028E091F7|nr:hypothetical protein [Curvibacter sp. APW13]MDT8992703.1 hypothetical protein [Curvibacter sp. APW13]
MTAFTDTSRPMEGQQPTSRLEWLAHAALHTMQLLRIGPFGNQQRMWQQAMESSGHLLSSQIPLYEAFAKYEREGKHEAGYALRSWQNQVIEPALSMVADILSDLHVFSDHPLIVQRGLFQSGLLPGQAASRILDSRVSVAAAVAKLLEGESIQTLRCPPKWRDAGWIKQSPAYVSWQIDALRGHPQQPVVYPVSNAQWSIDIRRWNAPLRVTLNAQVFDADVQQRLWTLNHVKVIGTMLWHPKIPSISNALLRNIANTDPAEKGIAELSRYLKEHEIEAIAGPIVLIDAIEKSNDVAHPEVVHAMQSLVDALLKVHLPGQKVGTIVWNALPAPWLYPPARDELVPDDWNAYEAACATVSQALSRISAGLREQQGHAMTSINLQWERRR